VAEKLTRGAKRAKNQQAALDGQYTKGLTSFYLKQVLVLACQMPALSQAAFVFAPTGICPPACGIANQCLSDFRFRHQGSRSQNTTS
jgi:hypothetical protein